MTIFRAFVCSCCALVLLAGCDDGAPAKPELTPAEAASKAIEDYDTDGDGAINADEAKAAPGLLAAFGKVDTDRDEKLSQDEIETRVNYYKTSTSWVINGACKVKYRGKPLAGATVTFEPESFLGASFKPCSGVTNERGDAFITRDNSDVKGIFLGFYRVRITKPKKNGDEMLKAAYNEETTLGFEANNDTPDQSMYSGIQFDLK